MQPVLLKYCLVVKDPGVRFKDPARRIIEATSQSRFFLQLCMQPVQLKYCLVVKDPEVLLQDSVRRIIEAASQSRFFFAAIYAACAAQVLLSGQGSRGTFKRLSPKNN